MKHSIVCDPLRSIRCLSGNDALLWQYIHLLIKRERTKVMMPTTAAIMIAMNPHSGRSPARKEWAAVQPLLFSAPSTTCTIQ
jgi:hypothetical protein